MFRKVAENDDLAFQAGPSASLKCVVESARVKLTNRLAKEAAQRCTQRTSCENECAVSMRSLEQKWLEKRMDIA
jgi:hypothetical protein